MLNKNIKMWIKANDIKTKKQKEFQSPMSVYLNVIFDY